MNIKALIKKYEELWNEHSHFYEPVPYTSMVELFLKELKQLDEPQPVKVPPFVADWYEENKDDFEGNLYRCTHNIPSTFDGAKLNEFERWFLTAGTKPFQTLVNMHQFGYEIEEEKRYLVKVKGIVNALSFLSYHKNADIWTVTDKNNSDGHRAHHTRKELEEADFGWVFDCEGVEVEEVE
ncbi:DUF1642 domain-containing protein [Streptococcus sp. 27098_8_76]|uniref:DUF1642 domain-containing protein n=1 Tax=Streptococcus sp. 27098_8_76 TaxID=3003658 RepID=UPI00352C0BDC